ncbi:MAG: CbtA family protein [Bauldia sp.]
MIGGLIIRGIVVGIVAGVLAFGFARAFGEGPIEAAIGFEEARSAATPEAAEPELFSRTVQSGIGLLTGLVAIGAAIGGLFAIGFAFANGRMGLGTQATSALLALFGLVSIYVVPAIKYPPNPPAASDPDTIKMRTALYFIMLAVSVGAALVGWALRQRLVKQLGNWNGSLAAAGAYLVAIVAAMLLLPTLHELPEGFPADTLWDFRLSSLGIQAVLWGSIGLIFGAVVERTLLPDTQPSRGPALSR